MTGLSFQRMWIVEDSSKMCLGRVGMGTASNILGITYYSNEPPTGFHVRSDRLEPAREEVG